MSRRPHARRGPRRPPLQPALGLGVVFLPVLWGCYAYQPATLSELAPGEDVRVFLTAEAVARVDSLMAIDREVEGTFAGLEGEDILLDVAIGTQQSGFHYQDLNQRLDLRTQDLMQVEQRSLDRTRTGLVMGTVGAVAAVIVFAAFSDSGGNTSSSPPTPADGIVARLLTFVLPWPR